MWIAEFFSFPKQSQSGSTMIDVFNYHQIERDRVSFRGLLEAHEEEEIAPLPIVGMSGSKPAAEAKPKKGIRKFWAWLKGEYDKPEG